MARQLRPAWQEGATTLPLLLTAVTKIRARTQKRDDPPAGELLGDHRVVLFVRPIH